MHTHKIVFPNPAGFSLRDTFTCGQCFRWTERESRWHGVVGEQAVSVWVEQDSLFVEGITPPDRKFFRTYFDLDGDYERYKTRISAAHPFLHMACAHAPGIRILQQDGWEALASFILSQNNNIPRITGIIDRLCTYFGKPLGNSYAFPTAERLSGLTIDELSPIRAGFRAKYLLDAARQTVEGRINFDRCCQGSIKEAREELTRIYGVGIKVAECALLYGFNRLEAFPIDVWMARAMSAHLPEGLPKEIADIAGVAQQYVFHYVRLNGSK